MGTAHGALGFDAGACGGKGVDGLLGVGGDGCACASARIPPPLMATLALLGGLGFGGRGAGGGGGAACCGVGFALKPATREEESATGAR